MASLATIVLLATLAVSACGETTTSATGLRSDFYNSSCKDAEAIVRNVVVNAVRNDRTLAAGLLRLHFHDAFVRGNDASVLLKSPNNDAERNALPNLSLRGFEVIEAAKTAVEVACPGIVSCADILALAARDAVLFIKGPWWQVQTGRRDGVESHANETTDLPPPSANFTQLQGMFAKKNLSTRDLVVLSGAHTIGQASCRTIASRIYDSNGNPVQDPSLDQTYAAKLRSLCPPGSTNRIDMDSGSSLEFRKSYFSAVQARRGLFKSDAALRDNLDAKIFAVQEQLGLSGQPSLRMSFFQQFGFSMTKLSQIGVLTGDAGQIREECSLVKSS